MPWHEREIIAWSVPDAARIIEVRYRTLRRWLVDYELVQLTFHPVAQRHERLRLTADDLAEAWCIADLRHAGVSMQEVKRILVRLDSLQEREQARLTDFKALLVDGGGSVIGIHDSGLHERLRDGQVRIDLERLRRRMAETPGEPVPAGWVRLARLEEAGCLV